MPFISDAEYRELQQLKNGANAQPEQAQGAPPAGVGGQYNAEQEQQQGQAEQMQRMYGQQQQQAAQAPGTPRVTSAPPQQAQQAFARNPVQAPTSSMNDPRNKGAAAWAQPGNQAFLQRVQRENPGAVFHPETGSWTAPQGTEAQANFQRSVTSATDAQVAGKLDSAMGAQEQRQQTVQAGAMPPPADQAAEEARKKQQAQQAMIGGG